jgi:hypothetical protein
LLDVSQLLTLDRHARTFDAVQKMAGGPLVSSPVARFCLSTERVRGSRYISITPGPAANAIQSGLDQRLKWKTAQPGYDQCGRYNSDAQRNDSEKCQPS